MSEENSGKKGHTLFELMIAKQLGTTPYYATRYAWQVSVGIVFALAAVIFGELKVGILLSILVLPTAHFTLWRAMRDARLEYENVDIKTVAAPIERLLNQHHGTIVSTNIYLGCGPVIVFRAPFQIAQYLGLILSKWDHGKVTYYWRLTASFEEDVPERLLWRLQASDARLDRRSEYFAFYPKKLTEDFEVIAMKMAKIIEANTPSPPHTQSSPTA